MNISAKEMIEALLKKLSKRRISKILGVEWGTVNNWQVKDQHPEEPNKGNLNALYKTVCKKRR